MSIDILAREISITFLEPVTPQNPMNVTEGTHPRRKKQIRTSGWVSASHRSPFVLDLDVCFGGKQTPRDPFHIGAERLLRPGSLFDPEEH